MDLFNEETTTTQPLAGRDSGPIQCTIFAPEPADASEEEQQLEAAMQLSKAMSASSGDSGCSGALPGGKDTSRGAKSLTYGAGGGSGAHAAWLRAIGPGQSAQQTDMSNRLRAIGPGQSAHRKEIHEQ